MLSVLCAIPTKRAADGFGGDRFRRTGWEGGSSDAGSIPAVSMRGWAHQSMVCGGVGRDYCLYRLGGPKTDLGYRFQSGHRGVESEHVQSGVGVALY